MNAPRGSMATHSAPTFSPASETIQRRWWFGVAAPCGRRPSTSFRDSAAASCSVHRPAFTFSAAYSRRIGSMYESNWAGSIGTRRTIDDPSCPRLECTGAGRPPGGRVREGAARSDLDQEVGQTARLVLDARLAVREIQVCQSRGPGAEWNRGWTSV